MTPTLNCSSCNRIAWHEVRSAPETNCWNRSRLNRAVGLGSNRDRGGDVVYRGGGPVASGLESVGTQGYGEASWGVLDQFIIESRTILAVVQSQESTATSGTLGVFFTTRVESTDTTSQLQHAGANDGQNRSGIPSNGDLDIQRGSAMLLRGWGEHPVSRKMKESPRSRCSARSSEGERTH